jgi:8-oxo-dGTP pyrophosphatase MutT (NUDIX family)
VRRNGLFSWDGGRQGAALAGTVVRLRALRVAALRRLYRVAWRGLQLRAAVWPRPGDGVKCALTHGGEVLLVRHTYGRRDTWYLPGGRVRRSEAPLAGAAREMEEELGLGDLRFEVVGVFETRLDRIAVRLTFVHAELARRPHVRVDPVEIGAAQWWGLDALPAPLGSEERALLAMLR